MHEWACGRTHSAILQNFNPSGESDDDDLWGDNWRRFLSELGVAQFGGGLSAFGICNIMRMRDLTVLLRRRTPSELNFALIASGFRSNAAAISKLDAPRAPP